MATTKLTDQGKEFYLYFTSIINGPITEIQARFSRFQSDLQQLAQKIGELESEAEEHEQVQRSNWIYSI